MVEKISKSEQKRLLKQVEGVARELAELTDKDIKGLPGNDEVKDGIISCRGLKGGAYKRQVKYLAKVLRQSQMEEIYLFLKKKKGSVLKDQQVFHQAERWRDILINEAMELYDDCRRQQQNFEPDYSSSMIDDALAEFPTLNGSDMRRSVYQYVRTRNRVHYRELFRMMKAAIETEERNKTLNSVSSEGNM